MNKNADDKEMMMMMMLMIIMIKHSWLVKGESWFKIFKKQKIWNKSHSSTALLICLPPTFQLETAFYVLLYQVPETY